MMHTRGLHLCRSDIGDVEIGHPKNLDSNDWNKGPFDLTMGNERIFNQKEAARQLRTA